MPDFNKFSADTPYIRPELASPGLSLIVKPTYDYVNTFPETANANVDGNADSLAMEAPDPGIARRKQLLGLTPEAPAAQTDYDTAKRYNRNDLGFIGGRDNEDLYAQNQGFFNSVGSGLGRLVGLTATKTGTGLGYLAGLVGIDNDSEKYGNGFSAWIAGAGDNGIAKWFNEIENDKIKQDWLPIYKKATEPQHGFFRHMGDLDFWTDDLSDGAAFIASSFVPGMAISKLNMGTKALQSLAALRGIGYMDEAAALAKTGVTGTVESANLAREGLGATVESADIANTIHTTPVATEEIPRVLSWIDNAKAVRSIDVGTTSIVNTASQAMYSANDAKNNAYDTLMKQKDENGQNKYTVDQARQISAKVAKDSYVMNLGALSLMNLWEANFLFKKPNVSNALTGAKIEANGLFGEATLAKKTLGANVWDAVKEPAKGFVTGGVWLGNMQLAIDRLNNNPDNFNLDFGDKLKALGTQYVKQTKDMLSGSDTDAAKSLGIGGLMAAGIGKFLGHNEGNETKKSLSTLNSQVSAFRDMGNIYQTETDGSLKLQNGSPVLDEDKMRSWVASMNNVLSLNQVARNFESRGVTEMAKIYQDEVFARFAKAHFDAGLSDLLHQKLSDISNIKPEDLALLGYDPDSKNKSTSTSADALHRKADDLESLYNNIQQNFISSINLNTEAGKRKQFDMTDKMFYLSARQASLNDRLVESSAKYSRVQADADAYNASYNSATDAAVTKYNELFEQTESAKRNFNITSDRQNQEEQDTFDRLNEGSDNIPLYKRQPADDNPFTESHRKSQENIDQSQQALDQFVNDNKSTLERLKKDSRGRYLYEIANKNLLPSAKEMERQQIIQAELGLASNATLNVLSRLADPKFGEKYYDQVYSKELERHATESGAYNDITDEPEQDEATKAAEKSYNLPKKDSRYFKQDLSESEINDAYQESVDKGTVKNKKEVSEYLAEKIATGKELTDNEKALRENLNEEVESKLQERAEKTDFGDLNDEINQTTKERDALDQQEDRTPEEEGRLDELNNKLDALEEQRETAFDTFNNNMKVDNSTNIKAEDKPTYKDVLKKIGITRKRVEKFDDYYTVDGEQYRKVTDLIGDSISPEQRQEPRVQAAVNAGNTIDALVKGYFSGDYTGEDFKNSMADKISKESLDNVIKSLDTMKSQLKNKGIEIIGSNVFVTDDKLKVAGEIDLLGVDKAGNFKIYEVQARRPDIYRIYGKRGIGVKIRDLDGKRLNMYRNMFANQYGVVPDEISVKFPVEVKYDRTSPQGFIEGSRMRDPVRFQPIKNVEIKMKNTEPIRIGSHFESVDMTKIFLDTFLSDKTAQDKLKFLFRNVKFDDLAKAVKLTVKPAGDEFQKRFDLQTRALNKEDVDFKIKKFKDYRNRDDFGNPKEFDNLYSLVGNTEASLSYEGQPIGYLSPVQTLAYKDIDGNFKVLDENTDVDTYSNVTGNSAQSYNEFRKVAASYKKLHTELTDRMIKSGGKGVTLEGDDLKDLVDLKMSQGELDLVKRKDIRPDLKDLSMPGVKVGSRMVPTVVNVDENNAVKVLMEKTKKNRSTISKYQDVDRWANQHLDDIKKAMTDRDGQTVTNNVGIIETASGDYKIISLKAKEGVNVDGEDDFVDSLGSKFTTSVTKNVFKNENIMVVPKESAQKINLDMTDHKIISKVYVQDDVDSLENFSLNAQHTDEKTVGQKIDDFLSNLSDKDRKTLVDMNSTKKVDIMNDYIQSNWSSIEDYIDNIKNCK